MSDEDKKNEYNNLRNDYDAEEKLVRAWIGKTNQDHYINKTGDYILLFLF